ncbi:MAG: monovalent cation/H(+) antiporter subunit G [Gammaproteobacteria bacterium]|nr:monovalent cation/H(+) antiporter subunit G [Gammaproteobacteria bacterium]
MSTFAGAALIVLGLLFFLSGTVGLLRFPDVFTRLHALSKADTLALGLICAGLALHSDAGAVQLKLLLIWLLVIVSGATCSSLIARAALAHGIRPWQR